MKDRKKKTFIYEDLGVPVKLINAPMKKMMGEWFIDINMETLQRVVLEAIIHKPSALTSGELRYIRNYLELSVTDFGKTFGVSHVAVVKWEQSKNGVNPGLEIYIRLYMMDYLHVKDKEFRALYKELSLNQIAKTTKSKVTVITIDATTEDLRIA